MSALSDLLAEVKEGWVYSPDRYPAMKGLFRGEKPVFAAKHTGLHMAKSIAPLAAELLWCLAEVATECEAADHSHAHVPKDFRDKMSPIVAKLLLNTLSLANTVGAEAGDLERMMREFMGTAGSEK